MRIYVGCISDNAIFYAISCYLLKHLAYSMKQPDLYYFETKKMTSQAELNFVWRIRAAGEYSL